MSDPISVEGALVATGRRFAIAATRFNAFIVEKLVSGAVDALVRHGVEPAHVTVVRVPGSLELPLVVKRMAESRAFDAVIALGCIVRGGTPHFEHVCREATAGVARASLDTGVPITMGVLTCDTLEQAIERAGAHGGNKGAEAAMAAIEMVNVLRALETAVRAEGGRRDAPVRGRE